MASTVKVLQSLRLTYLVVSLVALPRSFFDEGLSKFICVYYNKAGYVDRNSFVGCQEKIL